MTHSCISCDICIEHLVAAKAQRIRLDPLDLLGNLTGVNRHKYLMSHPQEREGLSTAAQIKKISAMHTAR